MSERRSHTGNALADLMTRRRTNNSAVAEKLGVSPQYVGAITRGDKHASAKWIDMVADVLRVTAQERVELHRAAARDAGFKLDLTKPK